MSDLVTLMVGDKVWFEGEKQGYTVRARNERFLICTKPFNVRKTVLYTIIDLDRQVRGTDNLIFGMGYETDAEIAEAMQMLQNHCDNKHTETLERLGEKFAHIEVQKSMEVSHRNFVPLDVVKTKESPHHG